MIETKERKPDNLELIPWNNPTTAPNGQKTRWVLAPETGNLYRKDPDTGEDHLVVRIKPKDATMQECLAILGIQPAIKAGLQRACDRPGCNNPATDARLIAPGTQIRVCQPCGDEL